MMIVLVTVVHVIVALVLIGVVLLQTGKRADLAGAFGGGGSQTAFGARGASTFFAKMTTTCAVLFMIASMSLAILTTRQAGQSRTVLDEVQAPVPAPTEQAPGPQGLPGLPPVDPGDAGTDSPAPAEDPSADPSAPPTEDTGGQEDGASESGEDDPSGG